MTEGIALPGTPAYEKILDQMVQRDQVLNTGLRYPLFRQGLVVAVNSSQPLVSVQLNGDTTVQIDNVKVLSGGYRPKVNDVVWLLQNGSDMIVMGTTSLTGLPKCVMTSTATKVTNPDAAEVLFGLSAGTFTTEIDTDSMADTNQSRITIKWPGVYMVGATICSVGNAAGNTRRVADIVKNGTISQTNIIIRKQIFSGFQEWHTFSRPAQFNTNDFIQLFVYGGDAGQVGLTWGGSGGISRTSLWAIFQP